MLQGFCFGFWFDFFVVLIFYKFMERLSHNAFFSQNFTELFQQHFKDDRIFHFKIGKVDLSSM